MMLKSLGLALLLSLLLASPAKAQSPTVDEIARQLVCQCGCNSILTNCVHQECMERNTMITLVRQKVAAGQSEEAIIRFFVAQYGEQVLASPPKQGFNLVAWVTPFVAILAGAAIIYLAIRAWVKRGQGAGITPVSKEGDEKYLHQLEEELKKFRSRGFR